MYILVRKKKQLGVGIKPGFYNIACPEQVLQKKIGFYKVFLGFKWALLSITK